MSKFNDDDDDHDDANMTLLDRTIVPILYSDDNDLEGKTNISSSGGGGGNVLVPSIRMQRIHMLHGTSLIYDACVLLQLNSSIIYAISCVIFHRFYFHNPKNDQKSYHRLYQYDVWSVAMACSLLATKLEDDHGSSSSSSSSGGGDGSGGTPPDENDESSSNVKKVSLSQIVLAFCHLYRKRLLLLLPSKPSISTSSPSNTDSSSTNDDDERNRNIMSLLLEQNESFHLGILSKDIVTKFTTTEKETKILSKLSQTIPSKYGPVYQEWCKTLLKMEQVVLQSMGYTFYYISNTCIPHKFILYFLRVLEIQDEKGNFAQTCWNYCNDSCRFDLCLKYSSEIIACSAIYLAANDFNVELPTSITATTTTPWWQVFLGPNKTKQLMTCCNAIAGLCYYSKYNNTNRTENNDNGSSNKQQQGSSSPSLDILAAHYGFIISLVPPSSSDDDDDGDHRGSSKLGSGSSGGGSFNDPDSFLWDHQTDLLDSLNL